jgi:hypothetical protein
MKTLSLYSFERNDPSLAGPFYQNHIKHDPATWAWDEIINYPACSSAMAFERPEDEVVLDLSVAANNPVAVAQIDALLGTQVQRSGPIRSSYLTWGRVPFPHDARHAAYELLATLNVDFRIPTPWYCADANGTLRYYVFFFLDGSGRLDSHVEGWSYHYDGGGPFCTGNISSGLDAAVPAGMAPLQSLLDTALPAFTGDRAFSALNFLPGHGGTVGFSGDNADNNVSLALVPRRNG